MTIDLDKVTLWTQQTLRLHIDVVLKNMIVNAAKFAADDEDWEKSSYDANMETAGFNEP